MKLFKLYFLILLLMPVSIYITAQEDIKKPTVYVKAGYIEYLNFPGISKDGNYIIDVHYDYSCCVSTEILIELREVNTGEIKTDVVICPSELEDYELTEPELTMKAKVINIILDEHRFESMYQVRLYEFDYTDDKKTVLKFEDEGIAYYCDAFNLPQYSASYHCCAYINDSIPCYLNTHIQKIWKAPGKDVIFISYGMIHQADGCDIGPFYRILNVYGDQ